ncbi:hypothetical protein EG68_12325 [Paragonimus skrjabini miyazakii]|uniref:Uncharacterized protein n=1 Tax=Paragonimus skrjabini miyazakii TaxID=59628 RepID=A0A8S9YD26_9TREM|nr:hypothetical protein EG68_12325 [Paragonimus skrjabini miyazakii]
MKGKNYEERLDLADVPPQSYSAFPNPSVVGIIFVVTSKVTWELYDGSHLLDTSFSVVEL